MRSGLEARGRMLAASVFLARGFALLAGRHRFAGAALAERASALMRAMMCDVATVSTLALRAKEQIAEARRREVDAAIGEFDGAIGAVIEAINQIVWIAQRHIRDDAPDHRRHGRPDGARRRRLPRKPRRASN